MNFLRFLRRRSIRALLRGTLRYVFGKRGERRIFGWRMYYRLRIFVLLASKRAIPSVTPSLRARLWVDKEAFPRIERLLRSAKHTIVIQMFIWKDDEIGRFIAAALVKAADRGVNVYITKEAVGDVFEFHRDFITTKQDSGELWKRFWNHPNIRITYATHHDHGKVYIIDGHIMLLTGMNIANEYHESWHDYLVELRGAQFVEHYLTGGDVHGPRAPVRLVMNTERRKEIRPAVRQLLQSAQNSIVLEQCYLSDPEVLDLLIKKSKEGVTVTVILPFHNDVHYYNNMQSVARLISEGTARSMKVFLYPRVVHGKIVLVDRSRAFVGSANLIRNSLDEMGEVNVLIEGRLNFAVKKLRDVLREDILISRPLLSPPHMYWFGRWLAWLNL